MTGKQLRSALIKFFGDPGYQQAAVKALSVDAATIYRWLAADKVPGVVAEWVKEKTKNIGKKRRR